MMRKLWSRKSRLILLENLEMYISVGISAEKAMLSIATHHPNKQKESLIKAAGSIMSGQSLSKILQTEISMPPSIASLISCGEMTGTLSKSIKSCSNILSRQEDLTRKCLSAMAYPILIGITALLMTFGLVRGIMPQIVPLLKGLNADLPFITVLTMSLSEFLLKYGVYIMFAVIFMSVAGMVIVRKFNGVRKWLDAFFLKIPVLKSLIRNYHMSIFFSSLGSLIESGIQSDTAFKKVVESVNNLAIKEAFERKVESIHNGEKLSSIFDGNMPGYVAPLINAGESSGNLAQALMRIGILIDSDLDHGLKRVTALIEPVMMICMGTVVGSVALSIMMPIYDISKTLQT